MYVCKNVDKAERTKAGKHDVPSNNVRREKKRKNSVTKRRKKNGDTTRQATPITESYDENETKHSPEREGLPTTR